MGQLLLWSRFVRVFVGQVEKAGLGVSLHLHLSVHLLHNSFLVNQEGGSFCAQKSSAIEAFLLPHSIEIQELSFGVAEQSEGQLMFLLEFPVRLDAVFAHSQYNHVFFLKLFDCVPELNGFTCASWGSVFRVEIQQHSLAFEILQRHTLSIIS